MVGFAFVLLVLVLAAIVICNFLEVLWITRPAQFSFIVNIKNELLVNIMIIIVY